ncbi:MAG: iron transporter [Lachnospiraceae bacterium]|nr:iron transporter [Lachnospiraceae bacterium]
MKNRIVKSLFAVMLCATVAIGCGKNAETTAQQTVETVEATEEAQEETKEAVSEEPTEEPAKAPIEDGTYLASFDTDGSMFHVNEAWDGKGILTVKDGEMTIHIVMPSKNTVNLYFGLSEDAQKDGAVLIDPTDEEVAYDDGTTEEVYAFDVPVPVLDEEYDVALIGKKQVWYDHKVKVSNPEPYDGETESAKADDAKADANDEGLTAEVTLTGGSGKSTVTSPAKIKEEDGKIIATIEWSSPHYDYMIVDGVKYMPVNTEGNSVFEIPIPGYNEDFTVIADTVAMSKPHEIEYVLNFNK